MGSGWLSLSSGRKFRTLNLMDDCTREGLWIEVDNSLPGLRVVQVLERVAQERGLPKAIQVDNGPEFISQVVDQWAYRNGWRCTSSSLEASTEFLHTRDELR